MKYYTVKEVSKIINFSEFYVRQLLREKKINGIKFGKSWRVKEEDLVKYLEGE